MLAIFRYVVKIEVFSEGKTRKKFSASGFVFRKINILAKVESRLKRGEIFCVKISQEKVSLNFKERLNDGNLWFLPFLFSKALWPQPKILALI